MKVYASIKGCEGERWHRGACSGDQYLFPVSVAREGAPRFRVRGKLYRADELELYAYGCDGSLLRLVPETPEEAS